MHGIKPTLIGFASLAGVNVAELTAENLESIEAILMSLVKWIIAGLTIYTQIKSIRNEKANNRVANDSNRASGSRSTSRTNK